MSDMKCPFCNKPLQPTHRSENEYWCENDDCTEASWKFGSISLWQELIRTRKALEGIKKVVDGFGWGCGNMHLPDYHDGLAIAKIVNEALEQKD